MPVLPNQRHELFALGVSKGQTLADAYKDAGYKRSFTAATLLAKKPPVAARIEELKKQRAEVATVKVVANKAWVMGKLTEVVELSIADKQYAPANKALELLGREMGLFVERRDIHIDAYAGLSDKQLVAAALKEIKLLVHEDTDDAIEGEYEEVGGDE